MVDRLTDKAALIIGTGSIRAAVYLVSDESRSVTGIELVVDAGITLKYA